MIHLRCTNQPTAVRKRTGDLGWTECGQLIPVYLIDNETTYNCCPLCVAVDISLPRDDAMELGVRVARALEAENSGPASEVISLRFENGTVIHRLAGAA